MMKNQTRQPEVWLIAYRMSEKWVTRVRALILVSELQKTKGLMQYIQGQRLAQYWWSSIGGQGALVALFN